ncbi:hypothetical protein JCM33774_06640 [Actinophytocola sp. KF-1]
MVAAHPPQHQLPAHPVDPRQNLGHHPNRLEALRSERTYPGDMQAAIGDRLHVHGRTVGNPDQIAEIIEVRGEDGGPPYVVRYPDGHEGLVFPGPDCVVEKEPS